jgi:hypothetical protein
MATAPRSSGGRPPPASLAASRPTAALAVEGAAARTVGELLQHAQISIMGPAGWFVARTDAAYARGDGCLDVGDLVAEGRREAAQAPSFDHGRFRHASVPMVIGSRG